MRHVVGDRDWVLGPGEIAEFDTGVPHWFGRTGEQPALKSSASTAGPVNECGSEHRQRIPIRYKRTWHDVESRAKGWADSVPHLEPVPAAAPTSGRP
jgi:hypothetical protein